jgi:opacity protein-like surface antigen
MFSADECTLAEKRKMRTIFFIIVVTILCCGFASAQVGVGINLYAGGGLTLPLNDLKSACKTGYHGTAGVGYSMVPGLEAVARYAYHSLPVKDDVKSLVVFAGAPVADNYTIAEYGLDIRANLAAPALKVRPYALVGAGMADIPGKSKFFYAFGGGIKVAAMPKLNFFLEGRYSKVSVDEGTYDFIPLAIGLNLSL